MPDGIRPKNITQAVKSVLVMAGSLKRGYPDVDEDLTLIRALVDSNVPKFLADDLPLFAAIVKVILVSPCIKRRTKYSRRTSMFWRFLCCLPLLLRSTANTALHAASLSSNGVERNRSSTFTMPRMTKSTMLNFIH